MPDDFNANTEGAASPSPSDVGATGAGGIDATNGQTAIESSSQGLTAPESTAEGLFAGWSFDDEQTEPESAIPESDDDIAGMLDDPKLDQAKVPKLVEDLRGARAEARKSRAEIRQLREKLAQLEGDGDVETVGHAAKLAKDFIRNPDNGVLPFLQELASKATPAYQRMVDSLVKYESEYLVDALRAAGKLPETSAQAPAAGQLTAEDWARIPKELHGVARQVPVDQLIQWLDQGNDDSLIYNLQREATLQELYARQHEQTERQWRAAVEQAQASGQQAIDSLSEQYEKAHYAQLSKWQPFGPEAAEQNQRLYTMILEGAHAFLLQDKQWQQVYQDAMTKLQQAPLRRLHNEHMAADADERDARGLAARYNARLGQIMKGIIQQLDSVFRDARAYRENQRQSAPDRAEIPGKSSQVASSTNGVRRLTEDGRLSNEYLEELKARHGIGRR
jgi:hypothetical protein